MADMRLASAGDDIKIWDCNGFILHKQFNPHSHNISSVIWSHDNSVLASASSSGEKVVLTYPEAASYTYSVAEKEKVDCVAFNSSSRYILGGSQTGAVHVWDLKTKSLKKSYMEHKRPVSTVQFNWNDTVIASGSESGQIILFNVVTGIASSPLVHNNSQAIKMVQYSHFKKSLIGSCSDSGSVCLWDANKRQLLNSFTSHMAPVMGIAFSPLNEMLLMSAGLDKRIVCYDVQGKKPVSTMLAESPLTSIDLMHDGATLAVGTTRGKIYIYDLRKGTDPVRTIPAHTGAVQSLSFQYRISKDGGGRPKSTITSSMKKANSITNINNNVKRTVTKTNGTTDLTPAVNHYSKEQTSTVISQTSQQAAEAEDVFSPIKETTTPNDKSPAIDVSSKSNNSSLNNYAGGVFSPVENDTSAPSSKTRGPPVDGGSALESMSASFISTHPPTTTSAVTTSATYVEKDVQREDTFNMQQLSNHIDTNTSAHSPRQTHLPKTSAGKVSSVHSLPISGSATSQRRSSLQNKPDINIITPPEATPAGGGAEGGVMLGGASQPFQAQFIKTMIEDALDDFRDQVRQDVLNLHMEMLKQFQIQQTETRLLLQQYSVNEELLKEIERLKDENKRLKKTY